MDETDKVLLQIEKFIENQDYIHGYASLAGGGIMGLVTSERGFEGEMNIQLVPASQRPMDTDEYVEKLRPAIMKAVKSPGANIKVMHSKMKGIRRMGQFDIELEIMAPRNESIQDIYSQAAKLRNNLKDLDYLAGLDISLQLNKPEYQIKIDRRKAYDLGINLEEIANTVKTMVGGTVPTRYKDGAYYYPIRVVMDEQEIKSQADLKNIYLNTMKGAKIPLSTIGEVEKATGPVKIDRRDQDRIICQCCRNQRG